jgi:hypothetical protein
MKDGEQKIKEYLGPLMAAGCEITARAAMISPAPMRNALVHLGHSQGGEE